MYRTDNVDGEDINKHTKTIERSGRPASGNAKSRLKYFALLWLILCLGISAKGQHSVENELPGRKLELKTTVLESTYCSATNLRLTLQLTFHNTGSQPILLRKDGFMLGRYMISKDLKASTERRYEIRVEPMMNSAAILRYQLERAPFINDSLFEKLEPDATYDITGEFHIPHLSDAQQPLRKVLLPGDHYLRILVWTWIDSQPFADQIKEKLKNGEFLWTNSVTSEPMRFTITKKKTISGC